MLAHHAARPLGAPVAARPDRQIEALGRWLGPVLEEGRRAKTRTGRDAAALKWPAKFYRHQSALRLPRSSAMF
jgi:hypothetical protein